MMLPGIEDKMRDQAILMGRAVEYRNGSETTFRKAGEEHTVTFLVYDVERSDGEIEAGLPGQVRWAVYVDHRRNGATGGIIS